MGSANIFISTVTDEFKIYREELKSHLERHNISVKVQEDFIKSVDPTLDLLDEYVCACEGVIHLVGNMTGSLAPKASVAEIRRRYPDMGKQLPFLAPFLEPETQQLLSYTQWEAWLAIYHHRRILIAEAEEGAEREAATYTVLPAQVSAQKVHLENLRKSTKEKDIYPFIKFKNIDNLIRNIENTNFREKLTVSSGAIRKIKSSALSFESDIISKKAKNFTGREWIFKDILEWQCARDDAAGLLIVADYGVGKSALLAKFIGDHQNDVIATYFFDANNQATLTPESFVLTLALRCWENVPGYREKIENDPSLQGHLETVSDNPLNALIQAVLNPLIALEKEGRLPNRILVIDALDEATSPDSANLGRNGKRLMELIKRCAGAGLRVLATSRVSEDVTRVLVTPEFRQLKINAIGPENQEDIKEYIARRVRGDVFSKILSDKGIEPQHFSNILFEKCCGKFLYAEYATSGIEKGMDVGEFIKLPPGMDSFYMKAFQLRFPDMGIDYADARDVLGILVITREPISLTAISQILQHPDATKVEAVCDVLSDYLRIREDGGLAFDHFSLEEWLKARNKGVPAKSYHVDVPMSEQRMCRACADIVAKGVRGLDAAADLAPYVAKFGVSHLVDGDQYAAALRLLASLHDWRDPPESLKLNRLLPQLSRVAAKGLEKGVKGAETEALRAIAAKDLRAVIGEGIGNVYETGIYVPPIRILIEFNPTAWEEEKEKQLSSPYDIVFRHDVGEAYAGIFLDATEDDAKAEWMRILKDMAGDLDHPYEREIAGYALRQIYLESGQKVDAALLNRYADSPYIIDRMVAGEILITLALQGKGKICDQVQSNRFWNPIWDYHKCDIDDLNVILDARKGPWTAAADQDGSLALCRDQYRYADELRDTLKGNSCLAKLGLGKLLGGYADQDQFIDKLEKSIDGLEKALDGEDRETVIDFLKLLMLHPLWSVTESVSSLLCELIVRDKKNLVLIDTLIASPHWRIRYCAVDAAYDVGIVDDYVKFKEVVLRGGRDQSCRVRGLCADDFLGWLRHQDCGTILQDPEILDLLQYWLKTADDSWLLEYVYLIFRFLHERSEDDDQTFDIATLMPQSPSRYLGGGKSFYECGHQEFLTRIEAIKAGES